MDRPQIGAETVPQWCLDARLRKTRGKTIVAGPEDVTELDETASYIGIHINGSRTIGEIANLVAAEYDVDADIALADIVELIAHLVSCQVVELEPVPCKAPGN